MPAAWCWTSGGRAVGDVLAFPEPEPEREPTCFACRHASLGPATYCTKFREEILFESLAAADCEEYEEVPDA